MPCRPFAMIRVFRPRPKRPKTPSCRMTSLAASAARHSVSSICIKGGSCRLTVGHLSVVDLAVSLDHPERVGNTIRNDGGAEADERQPGEPDDEGVLGRLLDVLGQEVVLPRTVSISSVAFGCKKEMSPLLRAHSLLRTRGSAQQRWRQPWRRLPTTGCRCRSP